MELDARDKIHDLGERMRYLLETYLLEPSEVAKEPMREVRAIRDEITSYGYLVQWSMTLNPQTLKAIVAVEIFEPKQNLSPELQAKYDAWFLEANKHTSRGGSHG